jgi:hypothetical protein
MTNTRSVLLLFVALLGLAGCSDDCPGCDVIPCSPPDLPPSPQPSMLMAGRPARLTLRPNPADPCGSSLDAQPTSATAEVYGPDGALVPSTIAFSGGSQAALTFTPAQPGAHHVLIAFEPVGGLHQFDLEAVSDLSADAPSLTLPELCTSLERTQQGAWVCGSTVIRNDTVVAQFTGARLAVAGDVVWVVTDTQARRFVDTGSALQQTHAVTYPTRRVEFLLASTDELLALYPSSLMRFTAGTELTRVEILAPWSTFPVGAQAPHGILLRDGPRVAVITRLLNSKDSTLQVCPYLLTASGLEKPQANCQGLPGTVAGFEPAVLWTVGLPDAPAGGVIRRWAWTAGRLEEQSSMNLGANLRFIDQPLHRSTAVPLVRGSTTAVQPNFVTTVAAWSAEHRRILLERLDSEIIEAYASPSFYWGRVPPLTTATSTHLRIRPSTP